MACFIRMFGNGIHGYLSIRVYFLFCFLIPTNRFAGRPGDYVYVFNQYRMEEVNLDMCALCIIYTCHSAVTVITVINTAVIIIILLEGPCCSFSVSFSFFSPSVCPWWLSYWVMYSAEHHHVGKTAHSEQYLWDWRPVSAQTVPSYIYLCGTCSVVPLLSIIWKRLYLLLR